jgi:hypothetical protein
MEARSNTRLAASDNSGGAGRENSKRNPANFLRICSGMRCGASGEPKTGQSTVFQPYRHFIRVKSCPQPSNNFVQARKKTVNFRPLGRFTLRLRPFPSVGSTSILRSKRCYCFIIEIIFSR